MMRFPLSWTASAREILSNELPGKNIYFVAQKNSGSFLVLDEQPSRVLDLNAPVEECSRFDVPKVVE